MLSSMCDSLPVPSFRVDTMRWAGDQEVFTISEVAEAVGVSQQTLRVWEAKKLLTPARSSGGQRLYTQDVLERAQQIAQLRRDNGWNPAAIATALAARPDGSGVTGSPRRANLRQARRDRGLTLKELSARVGVSSATLSALERGEAGTSSALIARLADALLIPMGLLASSTAPPEAVVRKADRPRTVNQGDVVWEELGSPGHDLEPALLSVPAGEGSGGSYSRPGETFVFMLAGTLAFSLSAGEQRELEVASGDALTIPARTVLAWRNPGSGPARALWVENLRT